MSTALGGVWTPFWALVSSDHGLGPRREVLGSGIMEKGLLNSEGWVGTRLSVALKGGQNEAQCRAWAQTADTHLGTFGGPTCLVRGFWGKVDVSF